MPRDGTRLVFTRCVEEEEARNGKRLVCSQCVEAEEADGGRRVRGSRKQILRPKPVLSPQRWAPSKAHLLNAVIMPCLISLLAKLVFRYC